MTSPAQEHRLILDRGPGGPRKTIVPVAFTVTARETGVHELESAWRQVVARHESLRSFFPGNPSEAALLDPHEVPFEHVPADLADDEELSQAMSSTFDDGFDLCTGPVARLQVSSRRRGAIDCLAMVDHIVFDGLSVALMLSELAAALCGKLSLRPCPRGYYEIVAEQREWLASCSGAAALRFWQEEYRGLSLNPELSLEMLPPGPEERPEAYCEVDLQGAVEAAQSSGSSLYTVVSAAVLAASWGTLEGERVGLMRPTPGRSFRGSKDVIGKFADVVPLAAHIIAGRTTYGQLLDQVGRSLAFGLINDRLPQSEVISSLFPQFTEESDDTPYIYLDSQPAGGVFFREGGVLVSERTLPEADVLPRFPGLTITLLSRAQAASLNIAFSPIVYSRSTIESFGALVSFHLEAVRSRRYELVRKEGKL